MDLASGAPNGRDKVKKKTIQGQQQESPLLVAAPTPAPHQACIPAEAHGGDRVQEAWVRATAFPGKGRSVLSAAKRTTGKTSAPCMGKVRRDPAQHTDDRMMAKTQPPCTRAEPTFGDSVLDEIEKTSFIALPGRGDSRLLP